MKIVVDKPTEDRLKELNVTSWPVWQCEPSTFNWHYDDQETCYILEGKVTVKTSNEEVHFGKGDWVVFPKGLSCQWIVHEKVKKHYQFG